MNQMQKACSLVYPTKCCDSLLSDFILESDCLKTIAIKTLGYGIIFGSTLVKLPQLLKLYSNKSGYGVSLFSVFLEILALSFSSSYSFANGFPFSAWGESLFLLLMTSFIFFLIVHYDMNQIQSFLFLIVSGATIAFLLSGNVPMKYLTLGQLLSLPLMISSKLVQAWTNFVNGHTGNLSAITVILIFIGSTTRILTSIQETGDKLIILSFILTSTINLILVVQIFFYWNVTNELLRKNRNKKKQ
ncbi:max-like protein X [Sarcoptes scabiei]|nr:max-like protein X [Sarcoptes scabiei]